MNKEWIDKKTISLSGSGEDISIAHKKEDIFNEDNSHCLKITTPSGDVVLLEHLYGGCWTTIVGTPEDSVFELFDSSSNKIATDKEEI